jgi:hypothetical protein
MEAGEEAGMIIEISQEMRKGDRTIPPAIE